MKNLDELLGPSKYLKTLDLFLQNPEEFMNLREIARRLDKNYITHTKIGTKIVAYKLNNDNKTIKQLQKLLQNLEE